MHIEKTGIAHKDMSASDSIQWKNEHFLNERKKQDRASCDDCYSKQNK